MAKRSRKPRPRAAGAGPPRAQAKPKRAERQPLRPGPPSRVAGQDERPAAPWGSFPLVELVVLLALGLFVAGLVSQGRRGAVMIGAGLALGSLAGLEVSIREHFAGYRSHTMLLAGAVAVATMVVVVLVAGSGLSPLGRFALVVAVFGVAFWLLRAAFRRKSGGLSFRVGGFR